MGENIIHNSCPSLTPLPSLPEWLAALDHSFPISSSFTCRIWFLHHSVHAGTSYLFTDLSFLGCPKVRMSQSQFCDCKILHTTKRASHESFFRHMICLHTHKNSAKSAFLFYAFGITKSKCADQVEQLKRLRGGSSLPVSLLLCFMKIASLHLGGTCFSVVYFQWHSWGTSEVQSDS